MKFFSHEALGFDGLLVAVEVDIRRTIPGFDLVGLADNAVREARERIRAAMRHADFEFPNERILVNLAPANLPKAGASYDLPICLAILAELQLIPDLARPVLALGELCLDGSVRAVSAVLPAIATGLAAGIKDFIVPHANLSEALALGRGSIYAIAHLSEVQDLFVNPLQAEEHLQKNSSADAPAAGPEVPDFSDLNGLCFVRRGLEIAAAGRHNVLLFGPPGSGKTMAAQRFPSILSDLTPQDSIAVTKMYSLAGIFPAGSAPLQRPPFRSPHHSASREGLIGGGKHLRPGEISLAHKGVLFLDEAPEFHRNVLQALREPLEEHRVLLARAASQYLFPADFQLIVATNPCPCGNLGSPGKRCLCSLADIDRYWKRLGAPLLDRIDIRLPVISDARMAKIIQLPSYTKENSATIRARVKIVQDVQLQRFSRYNFKANARIPVGLLNEFCPLPKEASVQLDQLSEKLGLSTRARHSVVRIARTIADLAGHADISDEDLFEAISYRRHGDSTSFWT